MALFPHRTLRSLEVVILDKIPPREKFLNDTGGPP